MLARLKQLLTPDAPISNAMEDGTLQLAAAALLLEVARADYQRDQREFTAVKQALQQRFGLSEADLHELLQRAESESSSATALYPFTRLINENCDEREKTELIQALWQVAAADGDIDKYEDHLIRQVADLLYVSHSDFIRTKLTVLGS